MNHWRISLAWLVFAACTVRGEPPEVYRPYRIIDLGTLGGLTSNAQSVNNHGQVVGEADNADDIRHAFLWFNGVMTDLGPADPLVTSYAWDINNLGQVVFNYQGRAFIWDQGNVIPVGALNPGGSAEGLGITMRGMSWVTRGCRFPRATPFSGTMGP